MSEQNDGRIPDLPEREREGAEDGEGVRGGLTAGTHGRGLKDGTSNTVMLQDGTLVEHADRRAADVRGGASVGINEVITVGGAATVGKSVAERAGAPAQLLSWTVVG